MNLLNKLVKKGVLNLDQHYINNNIYTVLIGSQMYGASMGDNNSDHDIVSVFIPRQVDAFPHLNGKIFGYDFPSDESRKKKETKVIHHIHDNSEGKEYDFSFHSIIKFMYLLQNSNPNILESIFVSQDCILHNTEIGQRFIDNRHKFLSRKCYASFRGYAYRNMSRYVNVQIPKTVEEAKAVLPQDITFDKVLDLDDVPDIFHKMKEESNRNKYFFDYGYDVKGAYHVVRLLLQCEQILKDNDLRLRENSELLKSIRRGEWSKEKLTKFADEKLIALEKLFQETKIIKEPDSVFCKNLLVTALEHHYGSIDKLVSSYKENQDTQTLTQIAELLKNNGYL